MKKSALFKRNEISSYIKLQDHEKRKTRAYSEDISKYYNMRTGSLKMNSSISAMTDVNCGISGQRAKSRMDIHRPLRYMVVQTAADVNIKRAVCISMMRRKMPKRTKS